MKFKKQTGKWKIQNYPKQYVVKEKKILCNYSIGLHEFLGDRHKVKVLMNMKAIQTPGTSKNKRLFKRVFGVK